jgi:hypothetical protein
VRATAPSTPPVAGFAFAPGAPPLDAPRTPVVDVVVVVVVEPVLVEPVVVVVGVVVEVDVEPVVVVVPVLVVEVDVVLVVEVDVVLVEVEVDVDVLVDVEVVPPLTHRLASWLCGPGVEGPRKMSPACLLWPWVQPLMLIEITT